jgi:magnesium transporter
MSDPVVESCCHQHPGQVAGLLRDQPLEEVKAFLSGLPPDTASRVLARLDSQQMSACLLSLDAGRLGAIVASAEHEDSVEIIAHLANQRYDELISAGQSDERALAMRLFAYSKRTLGAIANPDFLRVKRGRTCADVKRDLAAGARKRDAPLYLVDEKGVLLGVVPILALIADSNASLEVDRVARPAQPLSERMTALAALEARQWSRATVLPVVDADQRLIGTVSRQQLLRLVQRQAGQTYSLDQLTGDLAGEYLNTCASLMEMVLQGRSAR